MADQTKSDKVTLEELMVSTLAMTDALAKLMIAKGVITDAEFKNQLGTERGELSRRAKAAALTTMCGRFGASCQYGDIKVLQGDFPGFYPRYNIAPSQDVPVIVRNEDRNQLKTMRWGLVPSWAQDPSIGQRMINARAETLLEKPSFKQLVARRRCLVPADGFYEWRREGNRKVPMWIYLKNRVPFAFAGLWDYWRDPAGDKELYSFTIITTEANVLLRPIHNRMPVIYDKEMGRQWLEESFGDQPMILAAVLLAAPVVSGISRERKF